MNHVRSLVITVYNKKGQVSKSFIVEDRQEETVSLGALSADLPLAGSGNTLVILVATFHSQLSHTPDHETTSLHSRSIAVPCWPWYYCSHDSEQSLALLSGHPTDCAR